MTDQNAELQELQQQTARKRRLEAQQAELHAQRRDAAEQVRALDACMRKEQADVDRLEGKGLSAFFFALTGKREEKLTQEREEAYAARVKYEVAARELAAVDADLQRTGAELDRLQGCEARYQAALSAKAAAVRASGSPEAAELLRLTERLCGLTAQAEEIREAIAAGEQALHTAGAIQSSLDSAEGWGTLDLLGGGLLSDIAKHSHLDEAQAQVEQLQDELRRFKTELADVTIQSDLQVSIDGFLRFADYFFDGLFADWMVLDQIGQSQAQVRDTQVQIEAVLDHLADLLRAGEEAQAAAAAERDALVLRAPL